MNNLLELSRKNKQPEKGVHVQPPLSDKEAAALGAKRKALREEYARQDGEDKVAEEAEEARVLKAQDAANHVRQRRSERLWAHTQEVATLEASLRARQRPVFAELRAQVKELIRSLEPMISESVLHWPGTDFTLPCGNGRPIKACALWLPQSLEAIDRWVLEGISEAEARRRFEESLAEAPVAIAIEQHVREEQVRLNQVAVPGRFLEYRRPLPPAAR